MSTTSKPGYVCAKCNEAIKAPSSIVTYDEKHYHPACLCCSVCTRPLSGRQFVKQKTGSLICQDCNFKTTPKCKKCHQTFAANVSFKKLDEESFYHADCFRCAGPCGMPIGAEFYEMNKDEYFCVQCYDKSHGLAPSGKSNNTEPVEQMNNLKLNNSRPSQDNNYNNVSAPPSGPSAVKAKEEDRLCAKCNQKLSGTVTTYEKKQYHAKCFVCCQCNQEFKDNSFYKRDGEPLCRSCHDNNVMESASKCAKCHQAILDTVLTFKNTQYHEYCLVCTACTRKLVGQSIYTEKNDSPFCVECYTAKNAKYCVKCDKIIAPNQSCLVFDNGNYHKECFRCSQCDRVIGATESIYSGIVCEQCIENE